MIWLAMALMALATVLPLGWAVWRGGQVRGRREAAMALHRAQLAELDRDLAQGRLVPSEHAAAQLEVQRRLLADGALVEAEAPRSGRLALWLTGALVPAAAFGLYLILGHPLFPAGLQAPAAADSPEAEDAAKADVLVAQLRAKLAIADPASPHTLDGYDILGRAELNRGHLPEAAAAWQKVLAGRFDPTLAAETAEILTQMAGSVTPEAASLFRRALAEAPPDAPWRRMAEQRLRTGGP